MKEQRASAHSAVKPAVGEALANIAGEESLGPGRVHLGIRASSDGTDGQS